MGLFSKQPAQVFGYDDVVEYLRDLSPADYAKIQKVVNIYRNADKDVKKVLHIKSPAAEGFSDEELDEIFLIDDEPAPKPKAKKAKA